MVYLIHFQTKLHHAQHYLGFVATDLMQRIELHRRNRGAKLLAAANNNGIHWQVVRVWLSGDRCLERKLKNYKKSKCFCPLCSGKAYRFIPYLFTFKIYSYVTHWKNYSRRSSQCS